MQKIIYIRNHKENKVGDIAVVSVNVAHGLFEEGVAVAYSPEAERNSERVRRASRKKDRMMRAKRQSIDAPEGLKGRYIVK